MKKIFLLLLLLPLFSFAQLRDNIVIKTDNYEITYSEILEQPTLVKYTIPCVYGSVANSRRGMNFYKNDSIHTSDSKDYYNNVWDKGHMIPAAAFNCDKAMLKSTFSYLNCALQHEDLNRKLWKYLEAYEKKLTQYGDVNVIIRILFITQPEKLSTGATVPTYFEKTIYLNSQNYGTWRFPNLSNSSSNVNDFKRN